MPKILNKIHASFLENEIPFKDEEGKILLTAPESVAEGYFEVSFELSGLTGDEYVFMPACIYDGNRFRVKKVPYPPFFRVDEVSPGMDITITDVPRLNIDGTGVIEVTTGDLAVPCVGVYSQAQKKAVLIFFTQGIGMLSSAQPTNFGVAYKTGRVTVSYPHMRKESMYRHCLMTASTDKGIAFKQGDTVEIPYRIFEFDCADIHEFYNVFFVNRKCMGMDASDSSALPMDMMWKLNEDKFNTLNWHGREGYYGVGIDKSRYQCWLLGWTGGGISSFPLMKLGGELGWERAMSTLRFLFSTQLESGFFIGVVDNDGEWFSDHLPTDGSPTQDWHLMRKSADVLYFLFKHFAVIESKGEKVPPEFIAGTRKLADGFVKLWDKYGQLGQFVDVHTGDIAAGGTTSAGIAPAGLAHAWRYFGDERYIITAKAVAEQYYVRDLSKGYTTGGPGEIIQCPDSESAFGLLQSFVELYDLTREDKWLGYAKDSAANCSSWVMSYNYTFPSTCEFARLGMKTVGSVFANVQNKHSAPGICTLSGDSLYKLYRFTGDPLYLELIRDIARNIFQYMSRPDRPVYSWDTPPKRLEDGVICERVNTSDWEGFDCIGGVFYGSCWCETSSMLTIAELGDKHDIFGE